MLSFVRHRHLIYDILSRPENNRLFGNGVAQYLRHRDARATVRRLVARCSEAAASGRFARIDICRKQPVKRLRRRAPICIVLTMTNQASM